VFYFPDLLHLTEPALGSRALFPELKDIAFLAHAGVSPPSQPVCQAIQKTLLHFAREGPGAVPEALEQRRRVRLLLARLLGTEAAHIALTGGTTWGVLAVAQNFPWKAGDQIVVLEGDFPTNVVPWRQAALQHDLRLRTIEHIEQLEAVLREGVRLVALSAVQFQTGLRLPIPELGRLCHRYGAELFMDAIQALGAVPLDVSEVDYLSGGAHKWLMGVEGCGYLYCNPARLSALHRHWAGWLSVEEPIGFLFEPGQLRYDRPVRDEIQFLEAGSNSAVGFAALEASLEMLLALGVENIFAHLQAYHDCLEPALCELGLQSLRGGVGERSGILAFRPRGNSGQIAADLLQAGVRISNPDGVLRLAPHWPNALAECEAVAAAFSSLSLPL